GPATQSINVQQQVVTPSPPLLVAPKPQSEPGCRDLSGSFLCNGWKSEFGCTHTSVTTNCQKTCGHCQTQETQPLGNQPPTNQFPGNHQSSITNPGNQALGNRVIAIQPPRTQPNAAHNSGHLIISHRPDGQDSSQLLPLGPTQNHGGIVGPTAANVLPIGPKQNLGGIVGPTSANVLPIGPTQNSGGIVGPTAANVLPIGPTQNPGGNVGPPGANVLPIGPTDNQERPTGPPALFVTSSPASTDDRNIAISLFEGASDIHSGQIPPTKNTSLPIDQEDGSQLLPVIKDLQIPKFPETESSDQPAIPNSWKGDKSKLNYGYSPLDLAAKNESFEEMKWLIENGANIDHQDDYGVSALMWAAGYGNLEMMDLLLLANASHNLQDISGSTAMIFAAFNDNGEAVKKLLNHGADIDAQDSYGETALMNAALAAHDSTIEVLLENDAQVDLQDNEGMTALHYAALKQCVHCVKRIVRKCPDITLKNNNEKTPLDTAREKGNGKIITLIEGLIIPSCVHDGVTSLAGHRRMESCIELECKCGGYYDATGNVDRSCLLTLVQEIEPTTKSTNQFISFG
ncbi:unnamed protein product, partial [Meganyctiphanes norvegica]